MNSTADLFKLLAALAEHDLESKIEFSRSDASVIEFTINLSNTALAEYQPTITLQKSGGWVCNDLPVDDVSDLLKAYDLAERHCKRREGSNYVFSLSDLVDLINEA